MTVAVSREKLEAAHCWLDHDQVRGDPEVTEFRRRVRYHHAMWRMANGYPIGTHRVRPGTLPRLVGSHLDLDFARESGSTFLTTRALAAARARTSFVEPHQIFDHQSFWADLLSSEAMAVNLFGDLAGDVDRAGRARWTWGRYIVLQPEANTDIAHATDEYRKLLTDDATFTSATIEDLLAAKALAPRTAAALRRRYLP